jgi:hypothetical protein
MKVVENSLSLLLQPSIYNAKTNKKKTLVEYVLLAD